MNTKRINPIVIFSCLFLLKILDFLTTYVVIENHYGFEANPFTAYLLKTGGYPLFIGVGFTITVLAAVAFIWIQDFVESYNVSNSYKILIHASIYFSVFSTIAVIINNFYVLRTGIMG